MLHKDRIGFVPPPHLLSLSRNNTFTSHATSQLIQLMFIYSASEIPFIIAIPHINTLFSYPFTCVRSS